MVKQEDNALKLSLYVLRDREAEVAKKFYVSPDDLDYLLKNQKELNLELKRLLEERKYDFVDYSEFDCEILDFVSIDPPSENSPEIYKVFVLIPVDVSWHIGDLVTVYWKTDLRFEISYDRGYPVLAHAALLECCYPINVTEPARELFYEEILPLLSAAIDNLLSAVDQGKGGTEQ